MIFFVLDYSNLTLFEMKNDKLQKKKLFRHPQM